VCDPDRGEAPGNEQENRDQKFDPGDDKKRLAEAGMFGVGYRSMAALINVYL
jgi:hypothetical protein